MGVTIRLLGGSRSRSTVSRSTTPLGGCGRQAGSTPPYRV